MGTHYEQLSAEERATIMVMAQEGQSLRAMARTLHRAPSTISREWRRHAGPDGCPGDPRLRRQAGWPGSPAPPLQAAAVAQAGGGRVLFGVVEHFLREGWSPGQIAGAMKMMWPDAPERRVCRRDHLHLPLRLPRGALRQELIACLRKARLPRARGTDRRGQLRDGCDFNRCCTWYSIPPHGFRTKALNPISLSHQRVPW
jgi:IS30 family transposase